MQRALLVAAMCAALHAAAAAAPTSQAPTPSQAGVMHAAMVVGGSPAPATVAVSARSESTGAMKAGLDGAAAAAKSDAQAHDRPTTAAMLLAALGLMTGIALRRWGTGQQ
ncbi:MAG TPA: hypothetical protein VFE82_17040 [Ramlibacter sp.]|uniref:hypothetical protein n=1 Tax=Ramlibacter sp. TaxID=1917967 RepID=UPI002D6C4443|nr:hypothetical protein [Ramlibacter sp.]HZY20179.1 hypothetical protein [Ramlibacter sp.]